VYAISPRDPDEFLSAYQSLIELGSLVERPGRSVQPDALLANFWGDLPARLLILAALAVSLGILVWVSLTIPMHTQLPFRFDASGAPDEYLPAERLMLLPFLNGIVFLADLLLGMFFYRRDEMRIAAYMVWSGRVVTGLLFLGAIFFILQAG